MNPVFALLAPAGLLLSSSAALDAVRDDLAGEHPAAEVAGAMTTLQPEPAWQVRIEQQVTIRIAPRAPALQPQMFTPIDDGEGPRFVERKMGKCLPLAGIVGVQDGGRNKLILFLRDRRIVSASLEKACRARDFYSGFYVARNGDGMLCAGRDQLQARSGANCQLSGIRQLVEQDD